MKDDMKWEQKSMNEDLHASGPSGGGAGSGLLKAGLAVAAGLIIAALAKGVKNTDDLDSYSEEITEDELNKDVEEIDEEE